VFLIDDIDGILNHFHEPTVALFQAVSLMALGSILENRLESQTENAISAIAASVIFQRIFPNFDPQKFADAQLLPMLFNELWEIQQKDPKVIPETVAKIQATASPTSDVPDDMWISFVRDLCKVGGKDFTKVLERSKPIPLNISQSLQGLPQFQPLPGGFDMQ
jgi:hypothetical protein